MCWYYGPLCVRLIGLSLEMGTIYMYILYVYTGVGGKGMLDLERLLLYQRKAKNGSCCLWNWLSSVFHTIIGGLAWKDVLKHSCVCMWHIAAVWKVFLDDYIVFDRKLNELVKSSRWIIIDSKSQWGFCCLIVSIRLFCVYVYVDDGKLCESTQLVPRSVIWCM